ncbi:MAG: M28 family peptidase [Flavobacteriaceae bacterium]|nr:M28 family peptidase [Flavobacteriaceae bacterium]
MSTFKKSYITLFSLLLIIATSYLSFYSLMPDARISNTENPTEFSTKKALNHLKKITKKPHFTGSENHNFVRNYLKTALEAMGLQVEIQSQIAVNNKWGAATRTKNIIAKIPGSNNSKALLLLSHYDSNPHSSLGASDAASGIVTILESVRALLAQQHNFKNDIIICFSDAEELGLLGASAFVNYHPLGKNIGLVLNLEARGSGGPSYMLLETNGGNETLLKTFSQANTPYPVANSLMYSIYKMLPNDTDLTIFREDGNINGFNFAFIGDHFDYHTVQDSYERMDINTFKHQASYLLPLLHYYANTDLSNLNSNTDLVYFNFPGIGLVYYPFSWVMPMAIALAFIFLLILSLGISKRHLSIRAIIQGFIPFTGALIGAIFMAFFGWKLLGIIHPQYQDILQGFPYNGYYYIAMFVAFSIAIFLRFYKNYFYKTAIENLLIAPITYWILINIAVAYYLKGAGFFSIPLSTGILLLTIELMVQKNNKWKPLIYSILLTPTLILFIPLIKMFPVGLGLKMIGISAFFTVLLLGIALPIIHSFTFRKPLGRLVFSIGILAFIAAFFQADYSVENRQPNSIIYTLDVDTQKAYWGSYNRIVDPFTKQFLGAHPLPGNYDSTLLSSKYKTAIKLHQKAPVKLFLAPIIKVVLDTIINKDRWVHLAIKSQRNANRMDLITNSPLKLKTFHINGVAMKERIQSEYVLKKAKGAILSYYLTNTDEIIHLKMSMSKNQSLNLDLLEASFDLLSNPQFEITPRATYMMPMPFVLNDAIVLKKRLVFNKNPTVKQLEKNN